MALTFSQLFCFINLSHTSKTGLKEVVLNRGCLLDAPGESFNKQSPKLQSQRFWSQRSGTGHGHWKFLSFPGQSQLTSGSRAMAPSAGS